MDIASIIKDDFLVFDEGTTLTEMIGKLKLLEKRSALVFRNKKYLGMVEKKKFLHTNIDESKAKIGNYVQNTPILSKQTDLLEAARLLSETDVNVLPVEEDKKIVGIINSLDVVTTIIDSPEATKLRVNDVKYQKPTKIQRDDLIATAIEVMRLQHIDHLPIFDKDKLFGLLSYRDVIRKSINWSPKRDVSGKFNKDLRSRAARPEAAAIGTLPVEDFSTNDNLITTTSKNTLKEAINTMLEHNLICLPVMDAENYQGLLSVRSIMQLFGSLKKTLNFDIRYVGVNELDLTENQKRLLYLTSEREAEKLQRKIDVFFSVTLHVKGINKEGKQQEFEVKLRIELPGKVLASEKLDWDLETAVHKCFNVVKTQLR
jgi:CBS domain-containing protein